ncbi:MAG: hypothetical protein ACQEXJ_17295 [Myxococcota bacterium]
MMRGSRWRGLAPFVAAAVASACGGGDDSPGTDGGDDSPGTDGGVDVPSSELTVQERMDPADFEALAADDADLAAVSQGLEVLSAGVVEDSAGRRVEWAEGTDSQGALRTAVRACTDDGCTHALQTRTDDGLTWQGADGGALEPVSVGRPVLLKDLSGHDPDNDTSLAAGALTLEPDAVPEVDFGTRRFVALNTFGGAFGTRLTGALDAAKNHGGFDEVVEVQYAREGHVEDALRSLDAMDAVVWLTQGVREQVKDGWREARTVGLTVNRGVYGEATMTRDRLATVADVNVAGGPGIVFLAGGQTHSDGTGGQPDAGSVWGKLDGPDRILVGVRGHADVQRILAAATTFFDLFLSGDVSLGDALDGAEAHLEGTGATLATNRSDLERRWLRRYADVWDEAPLPDPSEARLITPITATVKCEQSEGGPKRYVDNVPDASPFADVTFDGGYFEGHRRVELTGVTADVTYRGVLSGFEPDDRILLEVVGDFNDFYRDSHDFGEGTIREVATDDDGVLHVRLDGPVHATPFTDGDGLECVMNAPQLSTKTSGLAELRLTP